MTFERAVFACLGICEERTALCIVGRHEASRQGISSCVFIVCVSLSRMRRGTTVKPKGGGKAQRGREKKKKGKAVTLVVTGI